MYPVNTMTLVRFLCVGSCQCVFIIFFVLWKNVRLEYFSSPHPVVCCVTTVILAACQQDMCLRAPSRGSRPLTGGACSVEPSTSTSSRALPGGGIWDKPQRNTLNMYCLFFVSTDSTRADKLSFFFVSIHFYNKRNIHTKDNAKSPTKISHIWHTDQLIDSGSMTLTLGY